jgi:hypothetical protein
MVQDSFRHNCILASAAFALALTATHGALARDIDAGTSKPAATFEERYPAEPAAPPAPAERAPAQRAPAETAPAETAPAKTPEPTPPALTAPEVRAPAVRTPEVTKESAVPRHVAPEAARVAPEVARARAASTKRARSRVVVVPRSFLDAGTEVLPGERKFLDYAFPPTHTPMETVQNTGGRVGWHNSPLPGPFFPSQY